MIGQSGFSELLWFIGRVEEVQSSAELPGHVRVRAYGIHPPYGEDVDTPMLPWAPVISSGMALVPRIGEMVIGFFIDGRDAQHPMVVGTIPGVSGALPVGSGTPYDDPYLKPSNESIMAFGNMTGGASNPNAGLMNSPETAAMGLMDTNGAITSDGWTFYEMTPSFGGQPDQNAVLQPTIGGANIQIGGENGSEHISMFHGSGSHVQIDEGGDVKIGSTGTTQTWANQIQQRSEDRYDIVSGNNLTIKSENGEIFIYGAGNINIVSRNDMTLSASGKIDMVAGESINMQAARIGLNATSDNIDFVAAGKIKGAAGSISLSGKGDVRVSSGKISLKAETVAIDDIVRLASGDSDDAESAAVIDVSSMPKSDGRIILNENRNRSPSNSIFGLGTQDDSSNDDPNAGNLPPEGKTSAYNKTNAAELEADPSWNAKIKEMEQKYGLDRSQIYAVIQGESSWNPQAIAPSTGASGFFQFMPKTAEWLGTNTSAIRQMTPTQQLELYDRYLSKFGYSGKVHLGIMQGAPGLAEKAATNPDSTIYPVGSREWRANPGWRSAGGGPVTGRSMSQFYERHYG